MSLNLLQKPRQFRLARDVLGLSQSRLGGIIGKTGRQISGYETGANPVPAETALLMQYFLLYGLPEKAFRLAPQDSDGPAPPPP